MSRVATNSSVIYYNGVTTNPLKMNRPAANGNHQNGHASRGVLVRSAAPPPTHKETVHACPLCNTEYKDPRVLPCTHTYCFDCIRDKLIKNSRLTCPKCHYQAHPFEENHLKDLPRNLILSQEWRIGSRPMTNPTNPTNPTTSATIKKPTVVPSTAINGKLATLKPIQNGSTSTSNSNSNSTSTPTPAPAPAPTSTSTTTESNGGVHASEPLPSVKSSLQNDQVDSVVNGGTTVSNLIKIYSEITETKGKRDSTIISDNPATELAKIMREAVNQNGKTKSSSTSSIKQIDDNDEVEYEEITWENVVSSGSPSAPPIPPHLQAQPKSPVPRLAPLEHAPTEFSSANDANIENLRKIISSIQEKGAKRSSLVQEININDGNLSGALYSRRNSIIEDEKSGSRLSIRSVSQDKNSNHSRSNSATSRPSPPPTIVYEPRYRKISIADVDEREERDEVIRRSISPSVVSIRHSIDRFPPPPTPKQFETFETNGHETVRVRSVSPMSNHSSSNANTNEHTMTDEAKYLETERFYPNNNDRLMTNQQSNSPSPTHRSPSVSVEKERPYSRLSERHSSPNSLAASLTTRVELLLSDQKRLEQDIQDHIKRLKYDYDDIRHRIDEKQSSIHNEVRNIAAHLDDDISRHYHQKQKIYEELAQDTTSLGTELERLKSNPQQSQTNKQQLWDSLQQIETNIRSIRHAVDQFKQGPSALTFAESRRSIGNDTLGQITYRENQSHSRSTNSSSVPNKSLSNDYSDQSITNLSPYKYLRIDHLSNLEPEAIAISENNKRILLGICNKLFILNENGDTIKTISVTPSIRGIAFSKKSRTQNIAYISHDETVSIVDVDNGQILDCVKETDSNGDAGTFLPLGIDTDNMRGDVYVCDYRNSCLIKFDERLEFLTQWRVYNHSEQYDEARPKLISIYGPHLYMVVEHSCKSDFNRGIAYTFSLHICDVQTGNIIKIIDAESLSSQRLRWPCSIQAFGAGKCYILDTMTSGKYFNGQWQKHWSRVIEIDQKETNTLTEMFQLDSEASTMAIGKQTMIITANNEILFVNVAMINQENGSSLH